MDWLKDALTSNRRLREQLDEMRRDRDHHAELADRVHQKLQAAEAKIARLSEPAPISEQPVASFCEAMGELSNHIQEVAALRDRVLPVVGERDRLRHVVQLVKDWMYARPHERVRKFELLAKTVEGL